MSIASLKNKLHLSELATSLSAFADKCTYLNDESFRNLSEQLHSGNIPGIKNEEYRYFSIENFIRKSAYSQSSKAVISPLPDTLPRHPNAYNIYVVDGQLHSNLSESGPEYEIRSFSKMAESVPLKAAALQSPNSDIFEAICLLYPSKGPGIIIHKNPIKPLCIWNILMQPSSNLHTCTQLTHLNPGVDATVLEYFITIPSAPPQIPFQLHFHEKHIEQGARLKNFIIQDLNAFSNLLSTSRHHLASEAISEQHIFSLNGEMIRNNHSMHLEFPGASGKMYGLSLGKNKNIIDHHTSISHLCENAESYEFYKGIAYDASTLIFNGKIYVAPHAQQTRSYQNSRFMLLGSQATIQAKPQLEIFANDVKCSHGSATGYPDEQALFYMQQRGISRKKALELWASGFMSELLNSIDDDFTRTYIESRMEHEYAG